MVSPELLRRFRFFSFMDDKELKAVFTIAHVLQLKPGDVLVESNTPADALYFLIEGHLPYYMIRTGVPVVMYSVSYRVSFEDLDLTTAEGMAEMTKRVKSAARQGCREIGLAYHFAQPNDWLCARHAANEAMAEVEELVAAN